MCRALSSSRRARARRDRHQPLDETHPLWPNSHYGAHKAALEAFVHSYGLGQGWPIYALRPTGIYGLAHPPQDSRWYDVVAQVRAANASRAARGGKEVHAADVARAVEFLLRVDAKVIAGQSFNCYDMYVAEEQVAQIAKELTGTREHYLESQPRAEEPNRHEQDPQTRR